ARILENKVAETCDVLEECCHTWVADEARQLAGGVVASTKFANVPLIPIRRRDPAMAPADRAIENFCQPGVARQEQRHHTSGQKLNKGGSRMQATTAMSGTLSLLPSQVP